MAIRSKFSTSDPIAQKYAIKKTTEMQTNQRPIRWEKCPRLDEKASEAEKAACREKQRSRRKVSDKHWHASERQKPNKPYTVINRDDDSSHNAEAKWIAHN
ncbi:hypothetical protein ElyMa_003781800 [Elysia marginata]|uniref:Uncharacterized protein n=1 Tax=Elysia marginata TaxID=1093978 RepID=A0AAV4FAM4_9GAST|nr:hypothetical protein ElyMa_003781800 [Elysia marginata]